MSSFSFIDPYLLKVEVSIVDLIIFKEREQGEGFAKPDIKIPGVLDLFTVVWSNPFGMNISHLLN